MGEINLMKTQRKANKRGIRDRLVPGRAETFVFLHRKFRWSRNSITNTRGCWCVKKQAVQRWTHVFPRTSWLWGGWGGGGGVGDPAGKQKAVEWKQIESDSFRDKKQNREVFRRKTETHWVEECLSPAMFPARASDGRRSSSLPDSSHYMCWHSDTIMWMTLSYCHRQS